MDTSELVRQLTAIVGPEAVIHHPDELVVYEYDGSVDRALPQVVVFPTNTEQIARVVRLASQHDIPLVPRGAGTGLSGGAVATCGGIVVALTRMNHVLAVDLENGLAVVEPGLINQHLTDAVSDRGHYYAPDPSSQKVCTLGGNVAENAGGPHCLRHGVTTNHVLALEVVLPDGEVVWLGSPQGDAIGYDLVGVMVGSEGTLGIVTQAVLRLLPRPEAVRTFLAVFDSIDDASQAVSSIIGHGIVPAALEMMDRVALQAVEDAMHAGYPRDAGAVLLVEVEGFQEGVQEQAEAIRGICAEKQARQIRVAETAAERELLWAGRKGAFGALGRLKPNYYIQDGVVPRTRLPQLLRHVVAVGEKYDLPIANIFHAGDGNLHPCILFDVRQPGELERVREAGAAILRACVEAGGTISGEHGIGLEKQAYMPWVFSAEDLEVMRRLKAAFNPRDILNPGKIFPTGASCAEITSLPPGTGLTVEDFL